MHSVSGDGGRRRPCTPTSNTTHPSRFHRTKGACRAAATPLAEDIVERGAGVPYGAQQSDLELVIHAVIPRRGRGRSFRLLR